MLRRSGRLLNKSIFSHLTTKTRMPVYRAFSTVEHKKQVEEYTKSFLDRVQRQADQDKNHAFAIAENLSKLGLLRDDNFNWCIDNRNEEIRSALAKLAFLPEEFSTQKYFEKFANVPKEFNEIINIMCSLNNPEIELASEKNLDLCIAHVIAHKAAKPGDFDPRTKCFGFSRIIAEEIQFLCEKKLMNQAILEAFLENSQEHFFFMLKIKQLISNKKKNLTENDVLNIIKHARVSRLATEFISSGNALMITWIPLLYLIDRKHKKNAAEEVANEVKEEAPKTLTFKR